MVVGAAGRDGQFVQSHVEMVTILVLEHVATLYLQMVVVSAPDKPKVLRLATTNIVLVNFYLQNDI